MGMVKTIGKIVMQVAILILISIAMNFLAQWLHLPIPGSILGIIVLFTLLKTNIIKLTWIEQGANWLLAELLLFFIPAAVGVMKYIPLLEHDGVRILIVVISSTVIVMVSSGLVASQIAKRKERKLS
ncbi:MULTISPECIES: CidA/LrgA family protein [Paenibacillus]|uniref:Holin-like protein CidA n=1 Tax=Paenibacillus vini TaxID=1476024 RepID=A0ABQ4M640_9BACL|nr:MULTISPECIES: CidA/LrgA family holin-like protein [Paenibacillus]MBQ4900145.1 CidA/LrgA family holin-like protein [Paenibacillus sp. Marseille-P2973]MDN4066305.1 CidA/LrgA family holin-like protein [Paenibacillus vini]GIP51463.1 holin-like protein CidA [Paenibacillus vini]